MVAIYVTLMVAVIAVCGFVTIFAAMFRHAAGLDLPSRNWLDELSIDKYAPLERLFDPEDVAAITAHPGLTKSMRRKLISARRRAARLYLSELSADFDRLFRIGREMLAGARQERPELASALFDQWLSFNARVFSLRLRLRLAPLGLAATPAGVVESLARLRNSLSDPAVV